VKHDATGSAFTQLLAMQVENTHKRLVLIGGAEDRQEACVILHEFVHLAGGPRAELVVATVATVNPQEVGAEYTAVFRRLGATTVRTLDISSREDANAPRVVDMINEATGVFFTGGDQLRITRFLGGTKTDTALHRRYEEGMVLAGTSAGASMMSNTMIVEGLPETTPRVGAVKVGPGMEFIAGMLIDQHFGQRGRLGRLLSAIAQYPHELGIGIDENTAAVVSGEEFTVIGEGAVTVIDAGGLTYTNFADLEENECLALCGVQLHILPAGYRFNLLNRLPMPPSPSMTPIYKES
jgi:cyanophycinase